MGLIGMSGVIEDQANLIAPRLTAIDYVKLSFVQDLGFDQLSLVKPHFIQNLKIVVHLLLGFYLTKFMSGLFED